MKHLFDPRRVLRPAGWWALAPTVLIIAFMLVLTGQTSASTAPGQPREMLTDVHFEEQKPLCQSCHQAEYDAWKGGVHAGATLDPEFQKMLSKTTNQDACLNCHTTGFDTGSGQFLSEGVSCEACHGQYKDGHPAQETMQLPMESETCHVCHQATFTEWEGSSHAATSIECFDCHQAHTQGLRTGSQQKLCAACHSEQETDLAHATHGINGLDCVSCHMSEVAMAPGSGVEIMARSHTFRVSGDVCAGCHQATIHTSSKLASVTAVERPADPAQQELEKELTSLSKRVQSVRNMGMATAGLALGFGGFVGLLMGIIGMSLWQKRD